MPQRTIQWQFPGGGLHRALPAQVQPPFSSAKLLNVRANDTIAGRTRGGSRPGLNKAFFELLGSGAAVRSLTPITYVRTDKLTEWSENFTGSALGTHWSAASWLSGLPTLLDSEAQATFSAGVAVGAVRSTLTPFDTASNYTVELTILPYRGAHQGSYDIFVRMDNTTPLVTTDGARVTLSLTGATGVYSGSLIEYNAGVATSYALTGGTIGCANPVSLKLKVAGNTLTVYVNGTSVKSQAISAQTGTRFGFGLQPTVSSGVCLIDTFRIQYYETGSTEQLRTILMASAGGTLYREIFQGELTSVGGSLTLASDVNIQGQEHLQKLYYADRGGVVKGTDGARGTGNDRLDSATYTDWTTLSLNANDFCVVITNGSGGGAINGTYTITGVASGELTLGSNWCTGVGATCTFRIERCPKVYDPIANTLTRWTPTAGTLPTGCEFINLFRDRIVLSGDPTAPHMWYMTAQGNALDLDYGASSLLATRAVAGNNTESGRVGEPITAQITHKDDYLIWGAANSIWVLRGDPAYGGSIDNVSKDIGIVKGGWCKGPSGELIFLSKDGIYMMPIEGGQPVGVSRDKLPDELIDVDTRLYTVSMVYDIVDRGVHIYLTGNLARKNQHFWFDWDTKGFFPITLPDTMEPMVCLRYGILASEQSAVLLGCRDGYIRKFHDAANTDDGTSITSYVLLGPMRSSGNDYYDGWVQELVATLGAESGSVTWSVLVGDTHEAIPDATAYSYATGTFVAGRNFSVYPRARGGSVGLLLQNAGARRWALESITAIMAAGGKHRLA